MTVNIHVGDEQVFKRVPRITGVDKTIQAKPREEIRFQVRWSFRESSRKKKEQIHFHLEVFRDATSEGSDSEEVVGRYRRFDRGNGVLTVATTAPDTLGAYAYRCYLRCEDVIGAWEKGLSPGDRGRPMSPSEYDKQETAEKDIKILLSVCSMQLSYSFSLRETRV